MLKLILPFTPLCILNTIEHFIFKDFAYTKKFLNSINPDVLEKISQKKALQIFRIAAQRTPAYKKFLQEHKINPTEIETITDFNQLVPQTDKSNYIKKYPINQRCIGGHLPEHGNIDESGGTTGKATNWIHEIKEEDLLFKTIKFEYNYLLDGEKKDYMVLSAWSMGPWATGIKFCELLEKLALVKSTGPNANDIVETIKMFGKEKHYLLGGYPPFVKNLLEDYKTKINWKQYNLDIVTGGEGVPVEWVYYVKKMLKSTSKIISSYGASDIDIGIGIETPLCFFIRELASKNEKLRTKLFGRDELPMIFQYNPLLHYINQTTNKQGKTEFEITMLDKKVVAPKIKYNIGDEGKRFTFKQMIGIVSEYYPNYLSVFTKKRYNIEDILHLPFLCIYGRSDGTLSFDGANVFPEQIEAGILRDKNLAASINKFKMEKAYDKKHTVQFNVHIELKEGILVKKQMKEKLLKNILEELLKVNPDFRESYSKNKTLLPHINLYHFGHQLFKKDNDKVKNIYMK